MRERGRQPEPQRYRMRPLRRPLQPSPTTSLPTALTTSLISLTLLSCFEEPLKEPMCFNQSLLEIPHSGEQFTNAYYVLQSAPPHCVQLNIVEANGETQCRAFYRDKLSTSARSQLDSATENELFPGLVFVGYQPINEELGACEIQCDPLAGCACLFDVDCDEGERCVNHRVMSEAESARYCDGQIPCSHCLPKVSEERCVLNYDCGGESRCIRHEELSAQEVDVLCDGESPCSLCAAKTPTFCATDGECGADERCYRLHSTHAPLPAVTYEALKREGDELPRDGAPPLDSVRALCEAQRRVVSGEDDKQTPLGDCFLCLSPDELCELSPQLCEPEVP